MFLENDCDDRLSFFVGDDKLLTYYCNYVPIYTPIEIFLGPESTITFTSDVYGSTDPGFLLILSSVEPLGMISYDSNKYLTRLKKYAKCQRVLGALGEGTSHVASFNFNC